MQLNRLNYCWFPDWEMIIIFLLFDDLNTSAENKLPIVSVTSALSIADIRSIFFFILVLNFNVQISNVLISLCAQFRNRKPHLLDKSQSTWRKNEQTVQYVLKCHENAHLYQQNNEMILLGKKKQCSFNYMIITDLGVIYSFAISKPKSKYG